MNKAWKLTGITILAIILILAIVVLVAVVNQRIQLAEDGEQVEPTGNTEEVNGYQMHVHTEGSGKETLVFLSNRGTSSPVLD